MLCCFFNLHKLDPFVLCWRFCALLALLCFADASVRCWHFCALLTLLCSDNTSVLRWRLYILLILLCFADASVLCWSFCALLALLCFADASVCCWQFCALLTLLCFNWRFLFFFFFFFADNSSPPLNCFTRYFFALVFAHLSFLADVPFLPCWFLRPAVAVSVLGNAGPAFSLLALFLMRRPCSDMSRRTASHLAVVLLLETGIVSTCRLVQCYTSMPQRPHRTL